MGRNRAFDETQVLDDAAATFVRNGYEATSVDDLVAALGVHRGSLYNTFGSKRGLFLKTLDRYIGSTLEPLRDDPDPSEVTERLVHGSALDLLLVAAVERGPHDPDVAGAVRTGLAAVERALDSAAPAHGEPTRSVALLGARLYARLSV